MDDAAINFSELCDKMRAYLERENHVDLMEIEADTLEEALNDASLELSVPYKELDYEILLKGSNGILGYGRKKWKIVAYRNSSSKPKVYLDSKNDSGEEKTISSDGEFFIKKSSKGVFLKVISSKGQGVPINYQDVLSKLELHSNIENFNKDIVKGIVENASGYYEKIADFESDPSENVTMMVHISENSMSVTIEFTTPGINGAEIFAQDIFNILRKYGVIDIAILKDKVAKFVDYPVYGEPIELARGLEPVKGKDSYIDFIVDENNRLGEYEVSSIGFRNVIEGEELARIIPFGKGVDGYTVFGKVLKSESGQDINFILGENTFRDGYKIRAKCNGYMSVSDGIISVHNIYLVKGDVGPATGDIVNNGMVLVQGNVLDGYNIMAKSGIEVKGLVGRCNLKTDGSIIFHSGVNGKGDSKIYARGNIRAKFLENVTLSCGGEVEVLRGIVNSSVSSKKRVLCIGKKSKIVGSSVYAKEEVRAYSIGSDRSCETCIDVGYDPEIKDLLTRFTGHLEKIEKRLEVLTKDIVALKKNIVLITDKSEKSLKIDSYNEFVNESKILRMEIKMIEAKRIDLQNELENTKIEGKVSVENIAYSGVKLYIKNAFYELSKDYSNVTFVEDDNYIKVMTYIPFKPR
ncbi:FapA family protein [Borreliella bavariensis]|uniref:FapA family protein n=1 Tax=Borreliella bavariensis TaxID=664662 RepID=UPI00165E2374|nr:FapA family protein [Borreliella bavariensis]